MSSFLLLSFTGTDTAAATVSTGQAYIDVALKYGWDSVTILYDDNHSMSRLKEVLDKTSNIQYPSTFRMVVKKLINTTENGYREVSTRKKACLLRTAKRFFLAF